MCYWAVVCAFFVVVRCAECTVVGWLLYVEARCAYIEHSVDWVLGSVVVSSVFLSYVLYMFCCELGVLSAVCCSSQLCCVLCVFTTMCCCELFVCCNMCVLRWAGLFECLLLLSDVSTVLCVLSFGQCGVMICVQAVGSRVT